MSDRTELEQVADAINNVAEALHQLGNAHAYNTGDGGQGAVEVLGHNIKAGFESLASSVEAAADLHA